MTNTKMTTHILGDPVPRKSNVDLDLARKVTKYYEEHPEELSDRPKGKYEEYILMPQANTYALGLRALQGECMKENNQKQPKVNFPDGRYVNRSLSFKENIKARVENYEKTHNPNGTERTLEERLFLINERWNDSCTGIVYKAGTSKFKIDPISPHLITLASNFKEVFVRAKYSNVPGTELDSEKGVYNQIMGKKDALNHPAWLAAVEEDKALLNSYVNIIFTELEKYKRIVGMDFWVSQNIQRDEVRSLTVGTLVKNNSFVTGTQISNTGGSFLLRKP